MKNSLFSLFLMVAVVYSTSLCFSCAEDEHQPLAAPQVTQEACDCDCHDLRAVEEITPFFSSQKVELARMVIGSLPPCWEMNAHLDQQIRTSVPLPILHPNPALPKVLRV